MPVRNILKQAAKKNIRGNYWHAVAVCLVLAFVVGAYPASHVPAPAATAASSAHFRPLQNSEIVEDVLDNIQKVAQFKPGTFIYDMVEGNQTPKGILATLFNNVTRAGSFVFGILNAANQFAFGDALMPGALMLVGATILFLFWLLAGNPLRVGACRFFIESRYYPHTSADRLFYLFRIKRSWNSSKVMFLKSLYITLWFFTIAGGPVKGYAYRMVPYILAENPNIPAKEAFRLSSKMMNGNKWNAFLLDISFLGWDILSFFTIGLIGHLFLHPYKAAADAELYLALRKTVPEANKLLSDVHLADQPEGATEYPVHLYPIPPAKTRSWMTGTYLASYSVYNLILIFFVFCVAGWLWEVALNLFQHGVFVNRGTMYGPWLPIYGTGGVGVIILFRKLGKNPVITFLSVTTFCGILEYFTSWFLETFKGERWWDYTGYFLNLDGRTCLEGLLVFGLGGCAAIYMVGPALNNLLDKMPAKPKRALCWVLITAFIADGIFSSATPNTAAATDADTGNPTATKSASV